MNELEIDDITLEHMGVKGMRWGVRKSRTGSGSRGGRKKKQRTPAEQARFNHRKRVGIEVSKAVLISAGAVGVGMLAGPVAAAGAAAVGRVLAANEASIRDSEASIRRNESVIRGGPDRENLA